MRTDPLIGRKPWFGPRRFGWGLGPISVEGWIVTIVAVAVLFARRQGQGDRLSVRLVPVVIMLVALLKGTSPGGPRARREFKQAKAEASEEPADS
jgi:hypothetical protein